MSDGIMVLMAYCCRCGCGVQGNPETMVSVYFNTVTQSPLNPDGTQVQPGQPNVYREPVCGHCERQIRNALPGPCTWPHARLDSFTVDTTGLTVPAGEVP